MAINTYTIENRFLAVKIDVSRNRICSFSFLNKRTDEEIKGENGSEIFCVNFKNGFFSEKINASELKIRGISSEEKDGCDTLVIEFSPVKLKGAKVLFKFTYELFENDWFIRKWLSASAESECKAVLDFVDYAPIVTGDSLKTWCVPKQQKSHISSFSLSLGQPVFVSSAFYGCEFPATVNTVQNGIVCVKYYSGKTLSELVKESGEAVFPKCVIGAADSDSEVRLRASLFEYIETISKPLKLRSQYNSWYDHMLNISAENIEKSFLEIEKAMTAVGSKPLDCYVVDDGWNDYQKDFWCFNSKFSNELYPSSALTKAFGSNFGLWLGPRGGYTTDTVKFAKRIENSGNGYLNKKSLDVDVGSDKYIRKTADFMLDCQKRFDLRYWKLDGFILKSCTSKNHDHITGGYENMYYYSEVWEKWIDVFDRLQKESKDGVFINLTSYAPPSPWFLQWVNSVWMQVSNDMGTIDKGADGKKLSACKKDKMLSYRDERYYDFSRVRKFCFPQSRLYNHDPIYANEAKVSMSDEEFREYLFSMAARGNAFWEFYYSFNMMSEEKWRINNSVLLFIEENLPLLKNSVMFGGRPALGQVYGYGCFSDDEGIVMLRNPDSKEQSYVLSLNHSIGAEKSLQNVKAVDILPYSENGEYGKFSFADTLNVHLAAYRTKIIHFSKKCKVLDVVYAKAKGKNTLEVMFNQTVIANSIVCRENKIVSSKLLDDYRSVLLTFENDFEKSNILTLSGIKDILLFTSERQVEFDYHENDIVSDGVIKGTGDFSITATTGGETDGMLYKQSDEIELKCENKKVVFKVGSVILTSKATSDNIVQITAVRERNGVLKLYLNKHLDSGILPESRPFALQGGEVSFFDKGKVRVLSKALAYDEV